MAWPQTRAQRKPISRDVKPHYIGRDPEAYYALRRQKKKKTPTKYGEEPLLRIHARCHGDGCKVSYKTRRAKGQGEKKEGMNWFLQYRRRITK